MITHGTIYAYRKGCRCDPCVQTNYGKLKRWRDTVRKKPTPEHVHGTINGYNVYKCRCDPCKAVRGAADAAARERRARARRLVAAGKPLDWDGDI